MGLFDRLFGKGAESQLADTSPTVPLRVPSCDDDPRVAVYLSMMELEKGDTYGVVFPHCDADVLHAPGECEFCDRHPTWQSMRVEFGINFTGQHDPKLAKCPAESRRDFNRINAWPGNRASVQFDNEGQ